MDIELLEKAVNDPNLGIQDQGVLLHFFFKGPQRKDDLSVHIALHVNELLQGGYLEADDDHYFIPGLGPEEADLDALWAAFYKPYPGVKTGINVDYTFFKKKYPKGKWKVILRDLPGHLQRQMEQRKSVEIAIMLQETHGNKHHGMFLPSWKNLRTYLGNKQGWLENYLVPEKYASDATKRTGAEPGNENMHPDYRRYYYWSKENCLQAAGGLEVLESQMLSEKEFIDLVDGREKPFSGYETCCTSRQLRQHLAEWQLKFFSDVYLRRQHTRLWDYCAAEFRREYKS